MNMFAKIGSWFAIRDEELEEDELYDGETNGGRRNVVPFAPGRRAETAVAVFAPRSFADVTDIADALRARQVAILNLQGADRTLLQRVVDFTSGVVYTIDGKIQKLAEAIYLVVPAGVTVTSANVREHLDADIPFDLTQRFQNNGRS
jgi:cell division inhibitor SepF